METRLETALTEEEAHLLVRAVKRLEVHEGETNETRMMAARLRRLRNDIGEIAANQMLASRGKTEAEIFYDAERHSSLHSGV